MTQRSISPYERYGIAVPIGDTELRVHTYIVTDTLTGLAHKYYGDYRLWQLIADRNAAVITDPRQIPPGTQLVIPALPLEKGRYEST